MLTIYKASAGSGKTYTLALQYISTLLGVKLTDSDGSVRYVLNADRYVPGGHRLRNRHRGILAITFTNKATGEMKSRILRQLNALTRMPASPASKDAEYAPTLMRAFGCSRQELADAALTAENELLSDYSSFYISTIDTFFQGVLRTFAREVDHQGDYAIEINDSDAISAGIGLLMDDLNFAAEPSHRPIKRWIETVMLKNIAEGKRFNVFDAGSKLRASLCDFVENMCSEPFRRNAVKMEEYLAASSVTDLARSLARIIEIDIPARRRALAGDISSFISASGYSSDILKCKVNDFITAWLDGKDADIKKLGIGEPDKGVTNKYLRDWHPGNPVDKIYTKSKLPKAGKSYLFPDESFTLRIADFVRHVYTSTLETNILSDILNAAYNLEFLGFAAGYINRYRNENNLILLSDTNELLRRIIKDEELPFVYERMGMSLTNLLIDEFQDTSKMQWENLKPLVSNALAYGNDNLIIGDVKQAIYRFRNSDSSMLDHSVQADDFPDKHILRGNVPAENTNHRSSHNVVRFNNTLFAALAHSMDVPGYETVAQGLSPRMASVPGYVHLRFMEKESDEYRNFDALAADILRQHRAGYRWKDIAILVRSRFQGSAIIAALMASHPEIPFISDEALLLDNARSVQLILSVLRLIDETYTLTGIKEKPITDGLPHFASRREVGLMISRYHMFRSRGLDEQDALSKAIDDGSDDAVSLKVQIDDILAEKPANIAAMVEVIIARILSPEIRRSEYMYLVAFQDVVSRFFDDRRSSLHDFLKWWEAHKGSESVTSTPDTDAVSVMTVHKSKGLEWPCVHIPLCEWDVSRANPDIWFDIAPAISRYIPENSIPLPPMLLVSSSKVYGDPDSPLSPQYLADIREQKADSLNLTYVAFTRAANELCITAPLSKSGDKSVGIGNDILSVLLLPASAPEGIDPALTVPLNLTGAPDGGLQLSIGIPTVAPEASRMVEPLDSSLTADGYPVVFRDDSRELTSLEDAITEARIDIGGEEEKEIVDAPGDGEFQDEKMRLAAERGTNLHNILSLMRYESDLHRAACQICNASRIGFRERREYVDVLKKALADGGSRVGEWFGPNVEVMPEREIFNPETDTTLRPDRIVRWPDGSILVVDYKFTSEPRPSHRRQLAQYIDVLSRIFPSSSISGCLWYPELNKLIDLQ